MPGYQLAQLNVGIIKGPMDSPLMADFAANLARINALAEQSPGFVWRLQTEDGDATAIRPFEDKNLLVNMSVWSDLDSLSRYVYHSAHVQLMRRRREWFERMHQAFLVLWWVPMGHRPSLTEAVEKLEALRAHGPTPAAFTFRDAFAPPHAPPCVGSSLTRGRTAESVVGGAAFADQKYDHDDPADHRDDPQQLPPATAIGVVQAPRTDGQRGDEGYE